ncbi:anti-sigma factor family protein [Candidatus Latescibacterota bacterium]
MRCNIATRLAALHAGGDLPDHEIPELMVHLEQCPQCAADYDELCDTISMVKKSVNIDTLPPLPDDFSDSVVSHVIKNKSGKKQTSLKKFTFFRKTSLVVTAAASLLIASLQVLNISSKHHERRLALRHREIQAQASADQSEIKLTQKRLERLNIEEPQMIENWEPTGEAGIFAIMHRPDPENKPETFNIVYLGQSHKLLVTSHPWISQQKRRLISSTGSPDNIFIAVRYMPESSQKERNQIKRALIRKFKPQFNKGVSS